MPCFLKKSIDQVFNFSSPYDNSSILHPKKSGEKKIRQTAVLFFFLAMSTHDPPSSSKKYFTMYSSTGVPVVIF